MLRAQEELLEPSRGCTTSWPATTASSPCSPSIVGFDGDSTHVGGAYVLAPDGSTLARSELGAGDRWIAVELDPGLLEQARENPWFALKKRRPEAYAELVVQQ